MASGFFVAVAKASLIDDLKVQIAENSNKVKELENKVKEYNNKLSNTKDQKNTLKNQISSLENEIYTLNLNIKKTQTEVVETTLNIDLLSEEIAGKNKNISNIQNQIASILQLIYEKDNIDFFSIVLSAKNFSQALNEKEYLNNLERDVTTSLNKVKNLKILLQGNKSEQESKRLSLYNLSNKLYDQENITSDKKKEKDQLLKETKNQESQYQKILTDLNKQRKNVEKEIGSLEQKLKNAINKEKLPKGKGILKWPVDNVRITQDYGMTSYAQSGAYNGSEHNGIDLGGSSGTPVYASDGGEVIGVGNNGRYAYGKWIAIRHNNGLVTLYGHLSLQKVKKGDKVEVLQLIAYMGATGYSTGPHLHFTIYAPDSFDLFQSSKVDWLWIPIGAPLNPYEYL
ncbi:MAG: peptidoglycan DD-metalloendopeptidase family protein [Patescibacteria group bacterium]